MKSVLFAASECTPFVRTDEMADLLGALPNAFDSQEWDIRVVIPGYSSIEATFQERLIHTCSFKISCGPAIQDKYVGIKTLKKKGVTYYFIDNQEYFSGKDPYKGLEEDLYRFTFFCKAVLCMLPAIGFQPDIIHCHDWQTSLIPVYLRNEFSGNPFFREIKTVLSIHHIAFQAIVDIDEVKKATGFDDTLFTSDKLEFHSRCSILKAGIVYTDYIAAVGASYAHEMQTDLFGGGLAGLLSARHMQMQGFPPAIDTDSFNPATDPAIFSVYDDASFAEAKRENKLCLQKELCLWENAEVYTLAMIMSFDYSNGMDLVAGVLEGLLDEFTNILFLGDGLSGYVELLRDFAWKYPNQVYYVREYDETLLHKVLAAADTVLYPCRQGNACAITMQAHRYGALPIAHELGGIKEIIAPFNIYENTGDGFSFFDFKPEEIVRMVNYSKQIYFERPMQWSKMVSSAMKKDHSWKRAAERYTELYRYLIDL